MFVNRKPALFIRETQIRVVTDGGDQWVGTSWLEERVYFAHKLLPLTKKCGNERSGVNLSGNGFDGNVIKVENYI